MASAHMSLGRAVGRILAESALRVSGWRIAGQGLATATRLGATVVRVCCILGFAHAAQAQVPPAAPDQTVSYTYGNAPPVITPSLSPTVTIVGVTPAQLGAATFTSTQLTYTPATTEIPGADHFGYEVKDSATGLTTSAMVTVNLTLAAPIANAAAITVAENGNLSFTPTYSDPNHLAVTITSVSTPSSMGTAVINSGGGSITYTPPSSFWCAQYPSACDSFTYTVINSASLSTSGTVTVVVTATPPDAGAVSINTAVNQTTTFDPRPSAPDPQGLPVSLTALSAPAHGAAAITGAGQAAYSPTTGYAGSDGFSYTVTNSGGGTASSTVSATVGGALTVTVSATTWNWFKILNGKPIEDAAINGGASGGQGPYTYTWQYISGVAGMTATAPTWLATQWSYSPSENNTPYNSMWELKVTDSADHVAYSSQVTVTFEWDNNE